VNRVAEGGGILSEDTQIAGYGRKRITGNRFVRNQSISPLTASGAAIELYNSSALISGNHFADNQVQGGTGSRGGALGLLLSDFRLENNIISNNATLGTGLGAGIAILGQPQAGTEQAIINNTIADNLGGFGVTIRFNDPYVVVLNSILWGNADGSFDWGAGTLQVQHSNVEGGWPGIGNTILNPIFADTLYRLQATSPCIGAGADSVNIAGTWHRAPLIDFGGYTRPMPAATRPDMGAWEEQTVVSIAEENEHTPVKFSLSQNYPNPFNPSTVIEFALPHEAFVTLEVYNLLGERVALLMQEKKSAGYHSVSFNAQGLASGLYLYRLRAGEYVQTKKLVLLR
jgi:hypothetical protein